MIFANFFNLVAGVFLFIWYIVIAFFGYPRKCVPLVVYDITISTFNKWVSALIVNTLGGHSL